jgi:hypothetical protein
MAWPIISPIALLRPRGRNAARRFRAPWLCGTGRLRPASRLGRGRYRSLLFLVRVPGRLVYGGPDPGLGASNQAEWEKKRKWVD